ncbi:hypothetical protein Tco_0152233 [Tanacetum coccineum]
MPMWITSRGVVLLILLMLGIGYLEVLFLHRSSINNSASLSNKFRGFYFIFKFGISSLLHQVITTIADRIRDNDTSQSKQNLQSSSMTFIYKILIIPSVLDSCFNSSTVCEVKRLMIRLDFNICALDKNFSSIWTYTTMMLPRVRNHHGKNVYIRDLVDFDEQVKTMKIQAGVQGSRPKELRRQLQLWKRFGRLYLIVCVLVRNINVVPPADKTDSSQQELKFLFNPLFKGYYTPTHVHAEKNNSDQAANASLHEDDFINPFFSTVEPKNIMEAMDDSAWIEATHDELHLFDRLQVWELVDKPFGKMTIKLKWLWKNKKDEDQ